MNNKNSEYIDSSLLQTTDFAPLFRVTYLWLAIGIAITAATSYIVAMNESLSNIFIYGGFFVPMITLFILMGLSVSMTKSLKEGVSVSKTMINFILVSVLLGTTMSYIYVVYEQANISLALLITAGMFVGISFIGFVTKKELSGMRSFLVGGLWGIILVSFVGIFFRSSVLDLGISMFGVLLFSGFIAYDTQNVKKLAIMYNYDEQPELVTKLGIVMALQLLLNFINLFLFILRILGSRSSRR